MNNKINNYGYGLYDPYDESDEEDWGDFNKNLRKPEKAAAPKPEVKKTPRHYGVYKDGVVNCTACDSDDEQFKCSNFRKRTNAFGCSFLFNHKDCMSIDVQQQLSKYRKQFLAEIEKYSKK